MSDKWIITEKDDEFSLTYLGCSNLPSVAMFFAIFICKMYAREHDVLVHILL